MIADLRPALRAFLLADADISTAVDGGGAEPRIYPVVLPQGVTAPSLVYTRISGLGDHHNEGPSGLNRLRVQIDAWAVKPDDADNLARLVKARLDGYRGPMGSGATEVQVQGVFWDSQRDDYDSEGKLHRVSTDYLVWLEER